MAVHWDATDVADYETLHADEFEWTKTQALMVSNWGFGLMEYIGLGSITEKNVSEFWVRLAIIQALTGAPLYRVGEDDKVVPVYYTREDIERRIGLSTNYGTKTRPAFMKNINLVMNNIVAK
jgi:hypothetical protein